MSYGFPFELDDFQKEAVNYIDEGKSVVVCAPTGAGKTVIAEHAVHKALENALQRDLLIECKKEEVKFINQE